MEIVRKLLKEFFSMIGALWRRSWISLFNLRRRLFRGQPVEYPVIVLDSEIPERTPQNPWWRDLLPNRKEPTSLEWIDDALRRIAADPETKGVVFLFKSPELSLARAQSLVQTFARFRRWDEHYRTQDGNDSPVKKVIAHIEEVGIAGYVAASGADELYMTPLADWSVLGLRMGAIFLKDALTKIGVDADVTQISPYKSAGDMFHRADMSDEHREQINWLLDGMYDELVGEIARCRGLDESDVKGLIDRAPLTAAEAVEAGLADGLAYEDQLGELLFDESEAAVREEADDSESRDTALLDLYSNVRGYLLRRSESSGGKTVGVLSLTGSIMMGSSRETPVPLPLFGSEQMGSATVQKQVRSLRDDSMFDAIVLHVDSPGGSALASDLMWRELSLLNQEKPVVVYMGDVAASGGYYIAMGGRKIVAQPTTITGSIGVVNMHLTTGRTYNKLSINREAIQRGENADYMAGDEPWTPAQQEISLKGINHVYSEFKQRVATGRSLVYDQLDPICMGRVWTGTQAYDRGLVDEIGDIHLAIETACRLADLPTDGSVRVMNVPPPRKTRVATPVEAVTATIIEAVSNALGFTHARQVGQLAREVISGDWVDKFNRERNWMIADWLPRIK